MWPVTCKSITKYPPDIGERLTTLSLSSLDGILIKVPLIWLEVLNSRHLSLAFHLVWEVVKNLMHPVLYWCQPLAQSKGSVRQSYMWVNLNYFKLILLFLLTSTGIHGMAARQSSLCHVCYTVNGLLYWGRPAMFLIAICYLCSLIEFKFIQPGMH